MIHSRDTASIDTLFIHCSDTPDGEDCTINDIDRWHREKGWAKVGYHYVIHLNGSVHQGRTIDQVGAHCGGYNKLSLGICLIGRSKYTPEQWASLRALVRGYDQLLGRTLHKRGHNEVSAKSCPGFDVQAWVAAGMRPLEGRLILTA